MQNDAVLKRLLAFIHNMTLFAGLPNCFVKCSGLEMVSRQYTQKDLSFVLTSLIGLFSINRVCMASNFPLTKLAPVVQNLAKLQDEALTHQQSIYNAYWWLCIETMKSLDLPIQRLVAENTRQIYRM